MKLLALFLLTFLLPGNVIVSANKEDPGRCGQWRARQTVIVNDKDGNERVLICLKTGETYKWKGLDNLSSLGEFFEPGKDCTDIAQNNKDARTGLYWISGYGLDEARKVWCDVRTDGGGFVLLGYKDSPVSWMQPSNYDTVAPDATPHWSSRMGNVSMTEFRVQVTSKNDSNDIKADWLYSFNSPRVVSELLVNDQGCTTHYPGVGNIKHVKDLRTGEVVSRDFRCSQFGPSYPSNLGWKMMNDCLKKPCVVGYAVLPGTNQTTRYDNYGGFSYGASLPRSGMNSNSAAFVGCEFGKCCSCFGPKGGVGEYCAPGCQSINNGTVTNETQTFFWVRTIVPKSPLWTRCNEYVVRTQDGKLEKYHVDVKTGTVKKGSCMKAGIPNLIDGVVNVADKEAQDKIPPIKGLLSFRKDNDKLYIANGTHWTPFATEKQNEELSKKLSLAEKEIVDLTSELQNVTAIFEMKQKLTKQDVWRINEELTNVTKRFEMFKNKAVSLNVSHINSMLKNITMEYEMKQKALMQQISRLNSELKNVTARFEMKRKESEQDVSRINSELKNVTTNMKKKENEAQEKLARIYSEFKNITMMLGKKIDVLTKKLNESKNATGGDGNGGGGGNGGSGGSPTYGTREKPGLSCKEILQKAPNSTSGVYWIKPAGATSAFAVYCDMVTHEGGWTLVYSYTFTEYIHFFSKHNAVTPRPNWPVRDANVPVSTTPPLGENSRGAVDWNLWKSIGREFMIKSNINDWIVCQPLEGSIVMHKHGSLKCTNIKNVSTKCEGIAPNKIAWHKYGPFLSATSVFYDFVSTTRDDWPAHDPCGRRRSYEKRGVMNPGGAIFLR